MTCVCVCVVSGTGVAQFQEIKKLRAANSEMRSICDEEKAVVEHKLHVQSVRWGSGGDGVGGSAPCCDTAIHRTALNCTSLCFMHHRTLCITGPCSTVILLWCAVLLYCTCRSILRRILPLFCKLPLCHSDLPMPRCPTSWLPASCSHKRTATAAPLHHGQG